ncbi:MAG: thioredoxin family protein [Candidatus Omnitrophota bacterium]|jgi:thioredoxin-related protein
MKKLLKIFLASLALTFTFSHAFAWENDLEQAASRAKANRKMIFVILGREACTNCQHLKKMIRTNAVNLKADRYIIADINCDNKKQNTDFFKRYSVGGKTLPFVVIARPDGTMLVSRTGYGEAADYQKLIKEAEKKFSSK